MAQVTLASQPTAGRESRGRRVASIAESILTVVVVVLLVLAVALAVLVRRGPDGESLILGHPVFSVGSGSMTPTFDTGDLIFDNPVAATAATHLHKGQIISFVTSSSEVGGVPTIITHRIVGVAVVPGVTGGPEVLYTTKGDANNAPDHFRVPSTAVLGIYEGRIPFGGYVLSYLHQPITFIVLILIPVSYLVFSETRRRWRLITEEERAVRDQGHRP